LAQPIQHISFARRTERKSALLIEIVAQDKPHIEAPRPAIVRFNVNVEKARQTDCLNAAIRPNATNLVACD
jgi:hypothetical protein